MAINRDKVLEAAQKYVEKKKYDKAVAELRKLVEADPNDARTLLKIGDLQAKQVLYADAINTYESVGRLYANQGFALKAIAVYKQIREIIAKHVPHLEERYAHIAPKLAELYQQLGLTSDALAALDEVATRLQRQQRDQEAIDVFRRIVELDPTNPLPHLRLAEALSRVKDVEGAVFEFKTAASQLTGLGRRDDALKVLERLLHHRPDPEQAKACAELYLARAQPQDGMQALAKLQICFQANPRDFDTLSLLARAFNAIGQGAKAIEVQKEMARVARDTGKTDLFREIVERLQRVAPHDEGVRRLAQGQTGSVQQALPQASPGYGSTAGSTSSSVPAARMPEPSPAPPPQQPRYAGHPASPPAPPRPFGDPHGQVASPMWNRDAAPPAFQPPPPPPSPPQPNRPNTQPIPRPQPDAYAGAPARPEPLEEVEELSYSAYEEELEEVVDEEGAETPYADAGYAENAEAGAFGEDGGDGGYAEQGGYAQQAGYGQQAGYAQQRGYAHGYVENEADYSTADGDRGGYGGGYGEEAGAYGELQDDLPPPSDVDVAEQVSKTLADANAFRRVRLYAKALETLRVGLEVDPRSMDLHEVYRDVLIESGQTEDAVQEMLVIASLYVDALDGESAARALQDVLAFDPQNERAIEMLQELGYEIVDENEEHAGAGGATAYGELEQDPLPAYDLDESSNPAVDEYASDEENIHVATGTDAPGSYDADGYPRGVPGADYRDRDLGPAAAIPSYGDVESDGYVEGDAAYGAEEAGGAQALPSFPLEAEPHHDPYAEAEEHIPSIRPHHGRGRGPAAFEDDRGAPDLAQRAPSAPPPRASRRPAAPGAAAGGRELEDALEEAEFFCSRGLYDDARSILTEQLGKHPNNPLVRERLVEIDAQEVQRGSGARERPHNGAPAAAEGDGVFDMHSSLDALESLDYANIEPAEGHANEDEQVDVEEVFAKFKEGVAKQIGVEDSDSHYNLGIAYKEMLLLDDAIREFDVAARDPKRECVCRSMIGMIQIERGNVNEAIDAFLQGLNASVKDPSQETVLCYEIGAAYEAKKMIKDALTYYQKAMRRDPNYRDVQERVRRLAKAEPKQTMRQAAVGADDEFDRAFDGLLSKA